LGSAKLADEGTAVTGALAAQRAYLRIMLLTINPALFDARDRALPGREMAALNELCRAIVELLRRPAASIERANVVTLR
jgi:hypothetical protein